MQGSDGLGQRLALYKQIGNDHLASDLFQKTTNFIDRALSKVFSKNSHNTAVKNLIQLIRENPSFGDKYANLAKAQLTSALERGKPLTGRLAAKVLQDVRIKKGEDLAGKANIDINIDTAFKKNSTEFNDMLDKIIKSKFKDGAKNAFSTKDKKDFLNDIKKDLKSSFKLKSPTLEEMKEKVKSAMTMRCNRDLGRIKNSLAKEATKNLSDKINDKLGKLGLDISLSEDVIFMIKEKTKGSLAQELSKLDHMVNSKDAERVRDKVIDNVCKAFTTVNKSGLPKGICKLINKLMAENVTALPSKDMALSFCQGYNNSVHENLLEDLEDFNPKKTDLFKMANDFFTDVEKSVIDPETKSRRGKMDAAPMGVLRQGFASLLGKIKEPIDEEMMTNVRNFIDKATEMIEGSDSNHNISRLNLFRGMVAKGFGLFGEMSAKAYMKENPKIPEGARGMIKQVYDEIPFKFQDDALELIKQNTTNGKGLPLGAKVVVTKEGSVKLSCNKTVTIDPKLFLKELKTSTTESSNKFDKVNMTKLFVTDLARGKITFKTDKKEDKEVVFTKKEGIDVKGGTTKPEVLFAKLKKTCRDNDKEAFALSILLNQQVPNTMSVEGSKLGMLGLTGGGGFVFGPGLEHGNYNVSNHGDGKYTVSYSSSLTQDNLKGYVFEDPINTMQIVGPPGQKLTMGLDFSYTVDLSNLGENISEVELSQLISFNKGPDISIKFLDKV